MNKEFESEVEEIISSKIVGVKTSKQVVFYGSSSFRLWESLDLDFPDIECLNIAFGGSTIQDCLDYFDHLLAKTQPRSIIFYAGDNDIGQGDSATTVFNRFEKLLHKIKVTFPTVPFTFLSIKPSPSRMVYINEIKEVNSKIKNLILATNDCHYIDIHDAMMKGGDVIREFFCDDELHMNENGYAIWKNKVRKHLEQHLL